jgi:hypothetical protein
MRLFVIALCLLLLSACAAQPKPAPAPDAETAAPKTGVVGLVQKARTRGINDENWKTAILGIVRNSENDLDANVTRTVYEVTVFYDDGQQEVIKLSQDPGLHPGQRIRVTGKKIEALSH